MIVWVGCRCIFQSFLPSLFDQFVFAVTLPSKDTHRGKGRGGCIKKLLNKNLIKLKNGYPPWNFLYHHGPPTKKFEKTAGTPSPELQPMFIHAFRAPKAAQKAPFEANLNKL